MIRLKLVLLSVALVPLGAIAEQRPGEIANSASLELLEFLGAWEDKSGQWVDPNALLEVPNEEMPISGDEGKSDE